MKKCIIMFVFFVVMLLIAALTDNTETMIPESSVVDYVDAEIVLTTDELKNNSNKTNFPR